MPGGKTGQKKEGGNKMGEYYKISDWRLNLIMFRDLLRYGKIKADFEVKENTGRLFRVRVFEYQEKKYFTVMCNGEPLRCEEV